LSIATRLEKRGFPSSDRARYIGDLRDHAGDVIERVSRGERLTVTRGGRPVAELRPLSCPGVDAANLLQRWKNLPAIDADRLRQDIDAVVDPSL